MLAAALLVMTSFTPARSAAASGVVPAPAAVRALEGCWSGDGRVMDKPVAIEILGKPILEGAMFAADAESHAEANTADRYAVHLVFGGVTPAAGDAPQQIIGFWSDSFGGDFVALGRGQAGQGQFEITYKYPDADYVNRWRIQGDRLSWTIVARGATGKEVPFATYSLSRGPC